jgi:hypothetical protein
MAKQAKMTKQGKQNLKTRVKWDADETDKADFRRSSLVLSVLIRLISLIRIPFDWLFG